MCAKFHRLYKGRYGGYAGEAAPEKVFDLLTEDDNIFLVDIRPEEQREKEGLPQLKLGARYKVAAFPVQVRRAWGCLFVAFDMLHKRTSQMT